MGMACGDHKLIWWLLSVFGAAIIAFSGALYRRVDLLNDSLLQRSERISTLEAQNVAVIYRLERMEQKIDEILREKRQR